jgi:hypothetical protein
MIVFSEHRRLFLASAVSGRNLSRFESGEDFAVDLCRPEPAARHLRPNAQCGQVQLKTPLTSAAPVSDKQKLMKSSSLRNGGQDNLIVSGITPNSRCVCF